MLMGDDENLRSLPTFGLSELLCLNTTRAGSLSCAKRLEHRLSVCLTPPVKASEQHDFRAVFSAALFMVQ